MPFVLDASFAASWFLPDEASPATNALLDRLVELEAAVPSLFRHEMRNLMLLAHRRGRLSRAKFREVIAELGAAPVRDLGPGDDDEIVDLAMKHDLTAYDAAYLGLALRERLPLATLDRKLAAAAHAENVDGARTAGARHEAGRRLCDRCARRISAVGDARPAAETLSEAEIDTLTHLAKTGTGPNSLRALSSDLAYLEAWARVATGAPLVWPASETTVLRFIAHHLWDEEEREKNPEHGMPEAVAEALRAEGRLKSTGPHAPATVRRRLALWSSLHRWRGLEGPFGDPSICNALRLAIRAADRPRARKSASAITRDVLDRLLATCGRGRAVDLRDRALLLLAFGSGGRRRSEIARLKVDDLEEREPVAADPNSAEWRKASRCWRSGCGARKPRRPTPARACSSSAGQSKLCAPGSPFRKSTPDRCFGGSTNGETSAPPRSIRKASTP